MSEFGQNLKDLVKKGIEAISSGAESLASTTRQKVTEYNLSNEKEDLFTAIGSKVYELWKQGVKFPDSLTDELEKAAEKEKALDALHADSPETAETDSDLQEDTVYDDTPVSREEPEIKHSESVASEFAAKNDGDIPVIRVEGENSDRDDPDEPVNCPLSSAINDLFEKMPPVDKMVDRVNSSLDDLGENLKKFTGEFDRQLNDFADQMMGKDDQGPKD